MNHLRVAWFAALVCMASMTSACAPAAKLGPVGLERLRTEREIVVVHRSDMPSFVVDRAAVDAAPAPDVAGASVVKDYGIENPIGLVQKRLVARMASEADLANLRESTTTVASEDAADLKRAIGPVTTLELRTTSWGVRYHPRDSDVYDAFYEVRARLLRLTDGEVVWQGRCETPKYWDDPEPALFDDLKAEGGRLLKARLVAAAERCADDLVAEFRNTSRAGDGDKREIVRKGLLLPDVRDALLGHGGLVVGPRRFEADFLEIPVPFGETLEVVKLLADARGLSPGSEIKIRGRTVNTPFEGTLEKTGAGRIEVKLDGLIFEDETQLRRVIDSFKGPALKQLSVDGRIGERLIKIRLGPKGVER